MPVYWLLLLPAWPAEGKVGFEPSVVLAMNISDMAADGWDIKWTAQASHLKLFSLLLCGVLAGVTSGDTVSLGSCHNPAQYLLQIKLTVSMN